jgi:hypothetical protein
MGAWSVSSFGNDDAADWAYELEAAEDLSPVEAALDRVLSTGPDYLEAPDAAVALAAIEVLARLRGKWGERDAYSEPVDKWVECAKVPVSADLVAKAQRVIERIVADDSEIKELWRESDEFNNWLQSVQDLQARLGA